MISLKAVSSKKILGGCLILKCRNFSKGKGALPGGFTQEGLQNFAKQYWDVKEDPTTTLSSQKVSIQCSQWLDTHDDASSELAKAYFGSPTFLPERLMMTPIYYSTASLPEFKENDEFLTWKVIQKTPLELICSWNVSGNRGLTMMAFDPMLKRVYHGSSVDGFLGLSSKSRAMKALMPFHFYYEKMLLKGMANGLEKCAAEQK